MLEEYHNKYGKEPYKPLSEVLARFKCIALSTNTSPTISLPVAETNMAEELAVQAQPTLQLS